VRYNNKITKKGVILMKRYLVVLIIMVGIISLSETKINAIEDDFAVIRVKDTLHISVLDNPQLSTNAVVLEDGYINFPYIGQVYVKGRKVEDVKKEITERLSKGYIKFPVVSISLTRGTETRKIYLYGEIMNQGAIPFEENLTLLKAISLANGIKESGLYGKIKVRSRKGKTYEYNENEFDTVDVLSGRADMPLKSDDIILVERNRTFIIEGEVNKPQEYPLKRGMTISRALSEAGGVTEKGLYGVVKLRRLKEGSTLYEEIIVGNGNEIENDMPLKPDDIISVEINRSFFVYGEVNTPGQYVLKKGFTVLNAITIAGGFTKWGSPDRVKILRKTDDGGMKTIKVDLNDVIKGNAQADIPLKPGDIIVATSGIL